VHFIIQRRNAQGPEIEKSRERSEDTPVSPLKNSPDVVITSVVMHERVLVMAELANGSASVCTRFRNFRGRRGRAAWGMAWSLAALVGGVILMPGLVEAAAARTAAKAGEPTAAEKFVLEQIAAGQMANLAEAPAREVRAVFLEELLTGARPDCVVHRNGVQLEGAIIREPLDLRNAQFMADIRLKGCRFEGAVNFSRSVFREGVSFEESVFHEPALFSEMKVTRNLQLQQAVFKRGAAADQMELTGQLLAGRVTFEDSLRAADFSSLKAGSAVVLTNAVFAGQAVFRFARIAESLRLNRAQFSNPTALVDLEGVKVDGLASLAEATFTGYISLKDAQFKSLDFREVKWPQQPSREWLWMNGLSCQRVSAGEGTESWRKLLQLVDRAAYGTAYSADVYACFGDFYRREGYVREANQFSIAQKRREREEVLRGPEWVWSLFLDWFVGYGRSPERALLWSVSIILLGMAIFRPGWMEPRTTNLKADIYSPFWYSIDLFLPLIKLQDSDLWKPRDDRWLVRYWSRLHTILGWALIPIALAAWTGMLEK
jgi:uncharacterized protein YjbI with pentapeptide repeats